MLFRNRFRKINQDIDDLTTIIRDRDKTIEHLQIKVDALVASHPKPQVFTKTYAKMSEK